MKIKSALVSVLIAIGTLSASAVPAKRTPFTVTQPDGTTLTLRRYGDERLHFFLTDDDKVVMQSGAERYCYARFTPDGMMVSTEVEARDAVRRTAAHDALSTNLSDLDLDAIIAKREAVRNPQTLKRTNKTRRAKTRKGASRAVGYTQKGMGRFTSNYPTSGKIKGLVVLVEYADVKFGDAYSTSAYQYFYDLLNKEGFSEYNGTGSAGQYFREQSMGKFDPDFIVAGPVTLSQNRSYYGGNDSYGNDVRPAEMVAEACRLLDGQIDFSEFDNDNDGVVDNVFVFYAGTGEASGGPTETVWPHSSELTTAGIDLTLDGVKLDSYACTNELQSGIPDGIGTFCHEFSHVMGLPDLYCTNSRGGNWTPGEYSVLDYGPYNNDSRTPPAYSAYERNAMGWLEPIIVESGTFIALDDIKDSNSAMLVATERNKEFFLFENRQQTGWDRYIPGHGMLIWHIDYNEVLFDANMVNNSQKHNYVDIVEANNTPGTNMSGYTWPGTHAKTEFTYGTTPSFCSWNGKDLNMPITSIEESDGQITFNVRGGGLVPPEVEAPTDKGDNYFVATWKPVSGATDYLITVRGSNSQQPPFYDIATFGNGTSIVLPTGWTTDAVELSTSASAVGNASPSLSFTEDGQMIESRVYNSDITYVSFWSCCPETQYYTSTFTVYALVGEAWEMCYVVSPMRSGATTTVNLPDGSRAVRIVYTKGAGALSLDDVKVHSDGVCDIVLAGYKRQSTGGFTSCRVNTAGLPYDIYKYCVQSADDKTVSAKSDDITVEMTAGVENITVDTDNASALAVSAVGTTISVNAEAGSGVRIYDAVGALVGTTRTSDGGMATLTVPRAGFYIVSVAGKSAKIVVR